MLDSPLAETSDTPSVGSSDRSSVTTLLAGPATWVRHRAAVLIAVVVTLGSAAEYLRIARHLWFFGDDWDFLLSRHATSFDDLMRPHNEHWSTVPVLVFRLLYTMFGVRHYVLYAVPAIAAHVVICWTLWTLARRAGAGQWATCGGVVLMAICGGGVENLTWDFQIGFVGSVMFGLLAVLAVDVDVVTRRHAVLAVLSSVLSLLCSGIGVTMLCLLAIFLLFRHGWAQTVKLCWLPAMIYVVWYLKYGHEGTQGDSATLTQRLEGPQYFWTGLTNVWSVNTGIPAAGFVLLLLLVGPLLVHGVRDRLSALATACAGGAVLLFILTAWGRVQFGIEQSTASRYVYIATALTTPAVIWLLSAADRAAARFGRASASEGLALRDWRGPLRCVCALTVVLVSIQMAGDIRSYLSGRRVLIEQSADKIYAGYDLAATGAELLDNQPDPHLASGLTVRQIRSAVREGRFPIPAVSAPALVNARAQMQVGVETHPLTLPAPRQIVTSSGVVPVESGVCAARQFPANTAASFVSGPGGAELTFVSSASALNLVLIVNGIPSANVVLTTVPGQREYLVVLTPDARVEFSLQVAGTIQFC